MAVAHREAALALPRLGSAWGQRDRGCQGSGSIEWDARVPGCEVMRPLEDGVLQGLRGVRPPALVELVEGTDAANDERRVGSGERLANVLLRLLVGLWYGEVQGRAKQDEEFAWVQIGLSNWPLNHGAVNGPEVAWVAVACHNCVDGNPGGDVPCAEARR